MGSMNRNRVILGRLLAGVIINASEFLINGVILRQDWADVMTKLGKSAEPSGTMFGHLQHHWFPHRHLDRLAVCCHTLALRRGPEGCSLGGAYDLACRLCVPRSRAGRAWHITGSTDGHWNRPGIDRGYPSRARRCIDLQGRCGRGASSASGNSTLDSHNRIYRRSCTRDPKYSP